MLLLKEGTFIKGKIALPNKWTNRKKHRKEINAPSSMELFKHEVEETGNKIKLIA